MMTLSLLHMLRLFLDTKADQEASRCGVSFADPTVLRCKYGFFCHSWYAEHAAIGASFAAAAVYSTDDDK